MPIPMPFPARDLHYFLIGYRAWLRGRQAMTWGDAAREVDPGKAHAKSLAVAGAIVSLAMGVLLLSALAQTGRAKEAILLLTGTALLGLAVAGGRSAARLQGFWREMVAMGRAIEAEEKRGEAGQ